MFPTFDSSLMHEKSANWKIWKLQLRIWNLDSDSKRIRQKFYQFFINEKFKKISFFLCAFYLIMCLMKSPKNFEKIAILKMWELIFFWGVKIHFGEKYAWFAIEILIHGSKSCLWDVLWSQKVIKKSSRFSTNYI